MGRVYIEVGGGYLQMDEIALAMEVAGAEDWELIDWDNIEEAPKECWEQFDAQTREYIRTRYDEEYQKYFAQFDREGQ